MAFEYSNLNDRSPGWLLRLARRLLPGVGLVENEIKPYAQAWQRRNLEALASAGPLWVVLGDSLSQGVGASSLEHSWVLQTWHALAGRGLRYRIVNLSFSGARRHRLRGDRRRLHHRDPRSPRAAALTG